MRTPYVLWMFLLMAPAAWLLRGADMPRNLSRPIERGGLPARVHVFEDYETDIEKRWWLRGMPESNIVPSSLSDAVPNRRACRATETKDFDDKMGDPTQRYKAVIFNPVPGPPMGKNPRLWFRYWLQGTDRLRVQIYSLSKGYHRHLTFTNLPQSVWQSAAVDMTQARCADGSGGPLSEAERIDDLQFYIRPDAELFIDDVVLYDAAPAGESESFPKRIIFTGWFDTGRQGEGHEWPGDFEIVKHDPPLAWKAARSVVNPQTGQPWIRVQMRGQRSLSQFNRLRFRYKLDGEGNLSIVLVNSKSGQEWSAAPKHMMPGRWADNVVEFSMGMKDALADEIRFLASPGAELLVDDVLLYEPGAPAEPVVAGQAASAEYWIEPMKQVHGRFTGTQGTFAHFGDSITVSMAFWAPLGGNPQNMSPEMARAHKLVKGHLKADCWNKWKGPKFGNNGSMTIRWAHENVDQWLKELNPEAALIMFGSNDVGQMDVGEYEIRIREVVARCLRNGTVVILSTMPPRSGSLDKSRQFAEAVRNIAREQQVPLLDYFGEILKRRPDDWDGSLPQFKNSPGDEYQVPTLIARDGVHPSNPQKYFGDYSAEGLRSNGYVLRNYLTLLSYAEVVNGVRQSSE